MLQDDPLRRFDAHAAVIAAREPAIHAFAHLEVAAARASVPAQAARGPLRGAPVGVKDIFDSGDMPTAYGVPFYAGNRPATDAPIVALVRRAGGVLIGKTVTTPYANLDPTTCENPRAPGHTPGGSSSGSAAAVAAGMAPFAIGTQTGGSVIRPASYCGVAGYKPSFDLFPVSGMKTFAWSIDTVGFFAPTVDEVACFAAALSGRDLARGAARPARLGLLAVPSPDLAEPAMLEALARAGRAAEKAGVALVDLGADAALQAAWEAHATIQNYEGWRSMAGEYDRFGEAIPPLVRGDVESGRAIAADDYDAARAVVARAREAAAAIFARVDALVVPAAPGAPPAGLGSTGRALFNRLWSLLGNPAVAVPGLSDASGLPLGMQIVGPFGRDAEALAIAAWLEGVLAAA